MNNFISDQFTLLKMQVSAVELDHFDPVSEIQ